MLPEKGPISKQEKVSTTTTSYPRAIRVTNGEHQ
ncbi:hypothetical protein Gohar_014346 [Gossypium harknessii]|uniref:Uncharacterized protein n=1 Tax=Gossypium harknessii TaxID=34285 RepID=A0A7J9H350_9ROSI|nr:hypothetical protein [Gossypium harknessii]